jgi:hypothetical protein
MAHNSCRRVGQTDHDGVTLMIEAADQKNADFGSGPHPCETSPAAVVMVASALTYQARAWAHCAFRYKSLFGGGQAFPG